MATTGFDWKTFVIGLLAAAPSIISAVEQIHGDAKSNASKTQLATESLLVATGVAQAVDPADTNTIAAASAMAGGIIEAFKTPAPAPAAAAPAAG